MVDVIAYYRVSTDKQKQSGLGIEAQHAMLATYLATSGNNLIGEYIEYESGKRKDRPTLRAALAHARKAGATLVIAKLDRLARNVHFISGLMEGGVDFVALDCPHATRFTLHVLAAVAEDEARRISERTKAALGALKARGVKLGKPENLTDEVRRKGCQANIDAARHDHVVITPLMQSWRARGDTLQQIANQLNERGIETRRGGQWSATQVMRVLDRD